MAVSPEHRGAGRGRALLRAVLERSYRHHGARSVWLDVKTHNHRARALYESEGFLQQRTLRNALVEPDGTASDLVIMVHRPR
jgi:diamine N-acetyltransferase